MISVLTIEYICVCICVYVCVHTIFFLFAKVSGNCYKVLDKI